MYDDFDLDRTTRRAWRRFQARLADRVVALEDRDVVLVEVETSLDEGVTGAAPYVQFCALRDDRVRVEVSSNEHLADVVALGDDAAGALLGLGWSAPTLGAGESGDGSPNFFLDAGRREGDRLVAMTVAALRDVFGVPHPAFLRWPGADVAVGAEPAAGGDATSAGRPGEQRAVMPESAEHLRALVDAALARTDVPVFDRDADGDIPVPWGLALLFVRVHDAAPVVEVFSVVLRDIQDVDRAAFEVGVLNRGHRLVKFVLVEDTVIVTVHLPAVPFAPRHLRMLLPVMGEAVDAVDDDLVARVGGRRGVEVEPEDEDEAAAEEAEEAEEAEADEEESEPEDEGLHPALLTLLHLDPEGEGLDPELAASVCDFDRDLVLTLLTTASQQEIDWRRSGDRALIAEDAEEARACFHEGRAWQATVETLRAALRVIVEKQRAESSTTSTGPRAKHRNRRNTLFEEEPGV